jgi:hypothetical protein
VNARAPTLVTTCVGRVTREEHHAFKDDPLSGGVLCFSPTGSLPDVVVLSFVALALLAFPTIAEATVSISRAEAIPKSAREVVPL